MSSIYTYIVVVYMATGMCIGARRILGGGDISSRRNGYYPPIAYTMTDEHTMSM